MSRSSVPCRRFVGRGKVFLWTIYKRMKQPLVGCQGGISFCPQEASRLGLAIAAILKDKVVMLAEVVVKGFDGH
jgi:hypothetical protein